MNKMKEIIELLKLAPLPGEGGYFRETYRSEMKIDLPSKNGDIFVSRPVSTAIYYFITPKDFSALHRISSDEVFHFYLGDPVEMIIVDGIGSSTKIKLGQDIFTGQQIQAVVPSGCWQGTRLLEGGEFALLGTTVSPGFDFSDFELGERDSLIAKFPKLDREIKAFTRG